MKYSLNYIQEVCSGDIQSVRNMVNVFLTTTPDTIDRLKQARSEQNTEQITMIAHQLKSSAGILDMKETLGKLEEIENFAKKGEINLYLHKLIDEVSEDFRLVVEDIKLSA